MKNKYYLYVHINIMNKGNKISDFWDVSSAYYDKHMTKTRHYEAQKIIIESVIDQICEPILDLACGSGFLIGLLSQNFTKIQGNDFSIEMVNLASRKYDYSFTNEDAVTLPSYNHKFKSIISCNLFYYIQDRDKAIKRWSELLRPKGKIIFIEENPFIKPSSKEMDQYSNQLMEVIDPISPEEIEKIMSQNGFSLKFKVKTKIDEKHSLYGLIFSI